MISRVTWERRPCSSTTGVATLGLALQRRPRALGGLRPLDLAGPRAHGGQHLVDGAVERELAPAVLHLVDAHAGLGEMFHDVRGLDLFTTETIGVVDQEHTEGRLRLECVEQGHEARATTELGAGDAVVGVLTSYSRGGAGPE